MNEPSNHPHLKFSSFTFASYFIINFFLNLILMLIRSNFYDSPSIKAVQIFYCVNIIPSIWSFYLIKKHDERAYLIKKTRIPNLEYRIEYNYYYVYTTPKKTSKAIYLVLDFTQVIFTIIVFEHLFDKNFAFLVPILLVLMTLLSIFRASCILYLFMYRARIAKRRQD